MIVLCRFITDIAHKIPHFWFLDFTALQMITHDHEFALFIITVVY